MRLQRQNWGTQFQHLTRPQERRKTPVAHVTEHPVSHLCGSTAYRNAAQLMPFHPDLCFSLRLDILP